MLKLGASRVRFKSARSLDGQVRLTGPLIAVVGRVTRGTGQIIILVSRVSTLSLSLSSGEAPLHSVFGLVRRVGSVPRIQIIVSYEPCSLRCSPVLGSVGVRAG